MLLHDVCCLIKKELLFSSTLYFSFIGFLFKVCALHDTNGKSSLDGLITATCHRETPRANGRVFVFIVFSFDEIRSVNVLISRACQFRERCHCRLQDVIYDVLTTWPVWAMGKQPQLTCWIVGF